MGPFDGIFDCTGVNFFFGSPYFFPAFGRGYAVEFFLVGRSRALRFFAIFWLGVPPPPSVPPLFPFLLLRSAVPEQARRT